MPEASSKNGLAAFLQSAAFAPAPVIRTDKKSIVLDLSSGSRLRGKAVAGLAVDELGRLINAEMQQSGTGFAFGRYGEPRELYANENFSDVVAGEARTIHLGIDLFCVAGTPVFAPLDGTIEIVANNDRELDYGPMLILRHETAQPGAFFTLYGHLSLDTLTRRSAGQRVSAGEQIASVGGPPHNGNWPPHLHMQVMSDLLGLGADFPGVAARSRQGYWFSVSPSPAVFFPECAARLLEYR